MEDASSQHFVESFLHMIADNRLAGDDTGILVEDGIRDEEAFDDGEARAKITFTEDEVELFKEARRG